MQINRIPKHAPGYTILDNGHVVRKHSLSWAARGLLGYLLSLPDGAREDVRTLAAKSVEGRATVARALRELEEAGHYVRRTSRDPLSGRVRTLVSVHEVPVVGKAVHTVPPVPASPAAGPAGAGAAGAGKAGGPSPKARTTREKEAGKPSVLPSGTGRPVAAPPRRTEGLGLLIELGRRDPRLALAGKPLTDQAARVEGLLAGGWAPDALAGILSAPLPEKVTRSVGAILGARLLGVPPVPPVPPVPTVSTGLRTAGVGVAVVPGQRRHHECPGRGGMCGRHVGGAGKLCAGCRGSR
ncbi:helix-turn-helix domain-containing protein [Streptomyces sp. BE303]|uniref:helix-turn-helix domain-containing protein n=1 Tax=Streptomyces sp. BE303 TaxID=3002528 RepID=UPI002E793668|nr:helix-turn-helix domain-containing protein [Streptomyces sp. BE303]MED7953498.1 helix-turn-helix domain-containing protein [Streptomyces sp. BE303]